MSCSVCLQEPIESPQIFFDIEEEKQNVARIVRQHFHFLQFEKCDNSTSLIICRCCWLRITDFHKFYMTIEQAHLNLLTTSRGSVEAESNSQNAMNLEFQISIKEEALENWTEQILLTEREADHENVSVDDSSNPLYVRDMLDCLEMENNKVLEISKSDHEVDASDNKIEGHKARSKKSKEPPCTTTSNVKQRTSRKRKFKVVHLEKNSNDDKDDVSSSFKEKRQISPLDDEIIKKHIPMGCDLCTFVGDDFTAMRTHFRSHHENLRPYVMCCNRKLSKRFLLVQHAYKHQDPEYFKCQHCQKIFSDRHNLQSHIKSYHATEEELKFMCDHCPKRFSRLNLLEMHKASHVPISERKFLCDTCLEPKTFASEQLLQTHIKMRHTKATNVCHVCAKGIRDKQAFEKHVRLHFEDSGPRVKCPRSDCDSWLKDEDSLKEHLRRHNDEGKIFQCNECDRICKNRRALSCHVNYMHTNKVFACSHCDKTFKNALSLKEHMAQHTGESLYKCPFCEKTFNSHANMHSHKKKKHPVEWENWRRTKQENLLMVAFQTFEMAILVHSRNLKHQVIHNNREVNEHYKTATPNVNVSNLCDCVGYA